MSGRTRRTALALLPVAHLLAALPAGAETQRFLLYDGRSYPPEQLPQVATAPSIYRGPNYRANSSDYWVPRAPDGHYYLPGNVNGHPVVFMVDTGASTTSLPLRTARNAGIRAAREVRIETAAGKGVAGEASGNQLTVGVFAIDDVKVLVQEGLSMPLLGMDVLSRYTITHHDGAMVIRRGQR